VSSLCEHAASMSASERLLKPMLYETLLFICTNTSSDTSTWTNTTPRIQHPSTSIGTNHQNTRFLCV